jgi:hypothetical protein
VPADSASGSDSLLTDCSGNSAAGTKGTTSETAAEAGANSASTVEASCLRNGGDCCFQGEVH